MVQSAGIILCSSSPPLSDGPKGKKRTKNMCLVVQKVLKPGIRSENQYTFYYWTTPVSNYWGNKIFLPLFLSYSCVWFNWITFGNSSMIWAVFVDLSDLKSSLLCTGASCQKWKIQKAKNCVLLSWRYGRWHAAAMVKLIIIIIIFYIVIILAKWKAYKKILSGMQGYSCYFSSVVLRVRVLFREFIPFNINYLGRTTGRELWEHFPSHSWLR